MHTGELAQGAEGRAGREKPARSACSEVARLCPWASNQRAATGDRVQRCDSFSCCCLPPPRLPVADAATFTAACLPPLGPAGYTAEQQAASLQVATGLFLMLALFGWPRAWWALTLQSAAISPVYALVTFIVVLQANLGG